jgi:microcin C transport system permease protein
MRDYFIRRLLLIIPTVIGATLLVFFITRIAPGGPLEARMRASMALNAQSSQRGDSGGSLSEAQKEQLKAYYGYDKDFLPAYLIWLGILPREVDKVFVDFKEGQTEAEATLKKLLPREQWTGNNAYQQIKVSVSSNGKVTAKEIGDLSEWHSEAMPEKKLVSVFRRDFDGILQGNLGYSLRYNDPVLQLVWERIPISLFFGIAQALLTYGICIPLGIIKAIKHRSVLDNVSSILIFVGYAIPGFVLGSVLVVYVAARWGWFPSGGFQSENFEELSFLGKAVDLLYHGTLPLICYVIGSFAYTTMLMKNNLMDNLAADYVRTAIAKGASFKGAVLGHALRNSLIPIVTTLGQIVLVFVGGSILIEKIFDINGFGLLSFQALLDRDFSLVMGILVIDVVLIMIGNILSDYFVATADPRIRFE